MKFGKEYASQIVPEWRENYMDYEALKSLLKEIQKNKPQVVTSTSRRSSFKRSLTLYRAFSGLRQRLDSPRITAAAEASDIENQAILVSSVKREGQGGVNGGDTSIFMSEDGGRSGGDIIGNEIRGVDVYLRKVDEEFNKVVGFYKSRVEEVMKEAALLDNQIDGFIAFRRNIEKEKENGSVGETTRVAADHVVASTSALTASKSSRSRVVPVMVAIEEDSESSSGDNKSEVELVEQNSGKPKDKEDFRGRRPSEVLEIPRDQVNKDSTVVEITPRTTVKGILKLSTHANLELNNKTLKKAKHQLKKAFVEFHHKIRLLKSFSFLNIMAFSKIMKKYDKITEKSAKKSYMTMVDNSDLSNSDELTKVMEKVEAKFIEHFCNSNRLKAMRLLRPKGKKEKSHTVTFSTGFLAGCVAALVIGLILILRTSTVLDSSKRIQHSENSLFYLYSLFGFIVLHMVMYAGNIYFWRRYRVNHSYLFGFREGTDLGYRQVLLLSCGFSILALAFVLANLQMEMNSNTQQSYTALTGILPLLLVLLVLIILVLPLNILYRSTRRHLLRTIFSSVAAPIFKVTLTQFFFADQLTSQTQSVRSVQYYVCYYGSGDFKVGENGCSAGNSNTYSLILGALPFMFRVLQSLRRLFDHKEAIHGYDALKYFSAIVAICMRMAYLLSNAGVSWNVAGWIATAVAVIFGTYWDIVVDWGLLQRNSKNRWLRDKLLIPQKSVYFGAIILNIFLRLAWVQTVLNFNMFSLQRETSIAVVACMEIIRRGIWNFFRLENEHLTNAGKYRDFRSVPLPTNYDEDDDKYR